MTRVLKRPMFRMGGNTDQGIMSGVVPRQGYADSGLAEKVAERKELLMGLAGQSPDRSLSNMLIDFGLNIASATPTGSIFSTAAGAAKEPFQRYQTAKAQRSAYDQQLGLSAAESIIAQEDKLAQIAAENKFKNLDKQFAAQTYEEQVKELRKVLADQRGIVGDRADDASRKIVTFTMTASEELKANFIGVPKYIPSTKKGKTTYVPDLNNVQVGQVLYDVLTGTFRKRVSQGNGKNDFVILDPVTFEVMTASGE